MTLSFLLDHPIAHSASFYFMLSCAALGTTLFALRIVAMMMFGLGDIESHDIEHIDQHGVDHHDMTAAKILTLHSIAGFLMMFGWISLLHSATPEAHLITSYAVGSIAGFMMIAITLMLMRLAILLEGKGAQFRIEESIGKLAEVYQEIPATDFGKIHVTMHGTTRELLARSAQQQTIPSFTNVIITKVINNEAVEVIIQSEERA